MKSSGDKKLGFAGLARHIAAKWKRLDSNEKRPYEALAAQDKERYDQEKRQWAERQDRRSQEMISTSHQQQQELQQRQQRNQYQPMPSMSININEQSPSNSSRQNHMNASLMSMMSTVQVPPFLSDLSQQQEQQQRLGPAQGIPLEVSHAMAAGTGAPRTNDTSNTAFPMPELPSRFLLGQTQSMATPSASSTLDQQQRSIDSRPTSNHTSPGSLLSPIATPSSMQNWNVIQQQTWPFEVLRSTPRIASTTPHPGNPLSMQYLSNRMGDECANLFLDFFKAEKSHSVNDQSDGCARIQEQQPGPSQFYLQAPTAGIPQNSQHDSTGSFHQWEGV